MLFAQKVPLPPGPAPGFQEQSNSMGPPAEPEVYRDEITGYLVLMAIWQSIFPGDIQKNRIWGIYKKKSNHFWAK